MVSSVDAFCTEQARRMHERQAQWISAGATRVVLTFDDGPHAIHTPKLLATLGTLSIKAVFFVVGKQLEGTGAAILTRVKDSGHQVGNHSYSHPDLAKLSEAEISSQLSKTQALIGNIGSSKKYFRPPYGSLNATVKKVAAAAGMTTVLWDVDTEDWKSRSVAWMAKGLNQIKPGRDNVVLMHDIHETTVTNVAAFVGKVRAKFPDVTFSLLP
jgi:peptidoglycan/xylan/chitin deacetylase (PgdA/CDA1 family)